MSAADRLSAFIADPEPSAIAMAGKWGQGKTYFWHQLVRERAIAAKALRRNYAYVSLFGLDSLSDLRVELAQKIRPVERIDDDTFAALLGFTERPFWRQIFSLAWWRRVRATLGRNAKSAAHTATNASVGIPHIGNLGPLYRGWAYSQVKHALICLDDLERRGSGLASKDVLGLVSQLVVERRCSVVVIFNEGGLRKLDEKIWKKNKEKVFLGEVLYTATPEMCLSYVFEERPSAGSVHHFAREAILDLGLTNVRIIERIKIACDQISPALPLELLDTTRRRIARCLALCVYASTGQGESAPPIPEIRRSNLLRVMQKTQRRADAAPPTPQEQAWDELLNRYNFHFHGELDEALLDAVQHGYPDEGRIRVAAEAYDASAHEQDRDENLTRAWRLFHDCFDDNKALIVERMSEAFFQGRDTISPTNADSSIRLIRALGDENLAHQMIKAWVEARATPERWRTLAEKEVDVFRPIEDPDFKTAIEQAYIEWAQRSRPSLEELLDSLQQERFIQTSELEQLAQASVEDFANYIRTHPGPRLDQTIRNINDLHLDDQHRERREVYGIMRKALDQIAAGDPTNQVRVTWKFPPQS